MWAAARRAASRAMRTHAVSPVGRQVPRVGNVFSRARYAPQAWRAGGVRMATSGSTSSGAKKKSGVKRGSARARPRTVLIDGNPLIYRGYYATPPLSRSDGVIVNAVYWFTKHMLQLRDVHDADYLGVFLDCGKSFRAEIAETYKSNRPETPADLVPQFALVREALDACNIKHIERKGYEADDLVATYARVARSMGHEVILVSPDKDFMQMVSGEDVQLYDPVSRKTTGEEQVVHKFGVGPGQVVDVQALAGDAADNVPGVPGIGIKTAAALIQEFGNLDNLLANVENIKQTRRRNLMRKHAEAALLSHKLVKMCDTVEGVDERAVKALARKPITQSRLMRWLRKQEFVSIISALEREEKKRLDAMLPSGDYTIVHNIDEWEEWVARARAQDAVAFSTGIHTTSWEDGHIVAASLSLTPGQAVFALIAPPSDVPLSSKASEAAAAEADAKAEEVAEPKAFLPRTRALAALAGLMQDRRTVKIGYDIKEHTKRLWREGIEPAVNSMEDVRVLAYELECGRMATDMSTLAGQMLNAKKMEFKHAVGVGRKAVPFHEAPLRQISAYTCQDADLSHALYRKLAPRLNKEDELHWLYMAVDKPLVGVLANMEHAGMGVDADELVRISNNFQARLDEISEQAYEAAGREFNVNSVKELGQILFEELEIRTKVRVKKSEKSGFYSTSSDVLEKLAAEGHELPRLVLEHRGLSKLQGTYAKGLLQQINPNTGRLHTVFQSALTQSGRLSSTSPNLQNIPARSKNGRLIKRAFVARPGHVILCADYSQVELRILAEIANIKALKDAFRDGRDIHTLTASQVFNVPEDKVDKNLRSSSKAVNFGIIYGMSQFGLSKTLGVSLQEASSYIESYFEQYPGIRDYMEQTREKCRRTGYVNTLFGRRCYVPGISSSNAGVRSFAERTAINTPIQGTSADITRIAMVRCFERLKMDGFEAQLISSIHDELVFEVPEEEGDELLPVVTEVMEGAASDVNFSVQLTVDARMGKRWLEED